jgi:hypothetical protein
VCLLGGILTNNGVKERASGVGLSDENFTHAFPLWCRSFNAASELGISAPHQWVHHSFHLTHSIHYGCSCKCRSDAPQIIAS